MATKIRGSNFSPSATTTITSIVTENSVDSALVTNLIDSAYITARASTYDSANFTGQLAAATTADLTEGSNLYYTTARADSDAKAAISVTDAGGDGSLSYSSGTITYTGPSASEVRAHFSAGTGVSISSGQVSIGQSVGTSDNVSFADVTLTGALNGPSTFYIDPAPVDSDAGLLVIRGDLQVDGTTTTVNSTTVSINDKNIVLADSAANAAEADGAGITVNGASATIQYDAVADAWDFNKDVDVTGTVTADDAVYVEGASPRLQIQDTDGTLQYSFLQQSAGTTTLRLRNDTSNGSFSVAGYGAGSTTTRFNIATNGDISFYDNTGATQGLFWDASTQRLGLGTTVPSAILTVSGSLATNWAGRFENTSASGYGVLAITAANTANERAFEVRKNTSDTAMLINGAGNVGIGTASVDNKLHLEHAGTLYLQIENTSTANKFYLGNSGGNAILESTGAYSMNFKTNGSERMRIDSSGNLLVGKTAANSTVQGVELSPNGYGIFTPSGNHALLLNRLSSDGAIATFRKDGTTVGSIGVYASRLYAGTGDVGLWFNDQSDYIAPINAGTSTLRDAAIDIGNGSYRFKNLYLSGTSYSNFVQLASSGSAVFFENSDYLIQGSATNGYLRFLTNNSEAMRIDSTGKLGIGTSSPSYPLDLLTGSDYGRMRSETNGSPFIIWARARGTKGSPAAVQNGDAWGQTFQAYDGTNYVNAARIFAEIDSTPGTNDMPTRLRFYTAGDGTTSLTNRLSLGINEAVFNEDSADVNFRVESNNLTHMLFVDAGNDRVGIGTSSPTSKLHVESNAELQIHAKNTNSAAGQNVYINLETASSTGNPYLRMRNAVSDCSIRVIDDGISFQTDTFTTERMRINSSGDLLVGMTSHIWSNSMRFEVKGSSGGALTATGGANFVPLVTWNQATSGTIIQAYFADGSSGVVRGSVTTDGSGTTFNTTSDYRLKENIEIIADAKERLLALKPVRHSWKDAPEKIVDGFIAHEVQEAGFEYAVTGEKDAEDMQSMDYGRITPVIVAALQDALKEIDMLKNRIAELEAK